MAKPKHIDITQDGVITQEALLAYVEGRLSADETVKIEELLKGDPFAQDALEGMRSSAAPTEIDTVVTSLNTQLREKTGVREKKAKGIEIHWATYAYAAMIVGILIGLGFVMIHFISDKEQRLAMNKTAPQAQESVPVTEAKPQAPVQDSSAAVLYDKAPAYDTISGGLVTGNTMTTTISSGASSNLTKDANKDNASINTPSGYASALAAPAKADQPQKSTANNLVTANTEQKAKAPAEKKRELNEIQTTKNSKIAEDKNGADAESGFIIDKVVPSSTPSYALARKEESTSASPSDNLKIARALFDAGDYKIAAKKYSAVLSDQPDNADALYFGGICDYLNGKGRQAEKNFDKLIKSNQYTDGAKWYKANILLDKGKKDEAKQLLRDLVNSNSSFKDRAAKKYEEVLK